MSHSLIAGAISGVVGLLVFLIIHHFWITPIWFIAPIGLVIAALGGLAVGWSYSKIRTGLPPRPFTFLALAALISLILAPSIILGQLRPSPLDITTNTMPPENVNRAIALFVLELLLTATVVGGIAGWFLGRSWQAALSTALAGFVFALGPGHNIPLLGNTPGAGKGVILLIAIIVISSLALVEANAWLANHQTT